MFLMLWLISVTKQNYLLHQKLLLNLYFYYQTRYYLSLFIFFSHYHFQAEYSYSLPTIDLCHCVQVFIACSSWNIKKTFSMTCLKKHADIWIKSYRVYFLFHRICTFAVTPFRSSSLLISWILANPFNHAFEKMTLCLCILKEFVHCLECREDYSRKSTGYLKVRLMCEDSFLHCVRDQRGQVVNHAKHETLSSWG